MKNSRKGKNKRKKTVSEKQLAANRDNAQKSTGAQTPQGKEEVKFHATTHGLRGIHVLLPGEDREAYIHHCQVYVDDMRPMCEAEFKLILRIAQNEWRTDRGLVYETHAFDTAENRQDLEIEIGRIAMYLNRISRNTGNCFRSLRDLRQLRWDQETRQGITFAPFIAPRLSVDDIDHGLNLALEIPWDKELGHRWKVRQVDMALSTMSGPLPQHMLDYAEANMPAPPARGQEDFMPPKTGNSGKLTVSGPTQRQAQKPPNCVIWDPQMGLFDKDGLPLDRDGSPLQPNSFVPYDVEAIHAEEQAKNRRKKPKKD